MRSEFAAPIEGRLGMQISRALYRSNAVCALDVHNLLFRKLYLLSHSVLVHVLIRHTYGKRIADLRFP